jgi:hypothetical protein
MVLNFFLNKTVFSLIYFISQIQFFSVYSSCVTGATAKNSTQCNKYNDENSYCCYLSPISSQTNESICYQFNITEYNGAASLIYNHLTYSMYCGLGTELAALDYFSDTGSFCGVINPVNIASCSSSSTPTDSCCFYQYDGMTGCYWLGAKFYGRTVYSDMTLICSGNLMKINFYLFLLILIFIYI